MKTIIQKRESERLRQQALEQLRETSLYLERELPGLLRTLRARVGVEPMEENIPIDRQKNIETVLRFIALKPDFKHKIM